MELLSVKRRELGVLGNGTISNEEISWNEAVPIFESVFIRDVSHGNASEHGSANWFILRPSTLRGPALKQGSRLWSFPKCWRADISVNCWDA